MEKLDEKPNCAVDLVLKTRSQNSCVLDGWRRSRGLCFDIYCSKWSEGALCRGTIFDEMISGPSGDKPLFSVQPYVNREKSSMNITFCQISYSNALPCPQP